MFQLSYGIEIVNINKENQIILAQFLHSPIIKKETIISSLWNKLQKTVFKAWFLCYIIILEIESQALSCFKFNVIIQIYNIKISFNILKTIQNITSYNSINMANNIDTCLKPFFALKHKFHNFWGLLYSY